VGSNYLVMELIEGPTLAERTAKGPVPLKEALTIARQIAEALEAAHEKGIVHRDLKPANIKLTAEGQVKVLDFGLAKVQPVADGSEEVPTLTVSATHPGMVVGTAAYMSPEQAAGKPVDKRADIWSFGVVLWELLAGHRLFEGDTFTQTLAEVLRGPIDFDQLPQETPMGIRVLLRRCLDRDVRNRLRDVGEARIAIEAALAGETHASADALHLTAPARRLRGLALGAVAGLGLAAAFFVGTQWRSLLQPPSTGSSFKDFQVTQLTSTGMAEAPAISPDGKYVAYIQHEGDASSLWVRQIDTASQVQIVPPEPGADLDGPTVTPDGGFVDFVRGSKEGDELWRVPFLGGTPKKLLDSVVTPAGWSPDGKHIAFLRRLDPSRPGASMAPIIADADGSHERQVTARQPPARFRRWGNRPAWSPDGRVVAILGDDSPGGVPTEQVVAVDVATGIERVLPVRLQLSFVFGFGPAWLDSESLVVTGAVEDGAPNQLWRLSYPGGQLSRLTNDLSNYMGVSLTADGGSLVTGRSDVLAGVWVGDGSGTGGAEVVPLALAPEPQFAGVAWAGERLLHVTAAKGHPSIAAFTGRTMSDEIVTRGHTPTSTPDGRTIVFMSAESHDRAGLWKVDAGGGHAVQLVSGDARWQVITPDGRRVIFVSSRSGVQRLWSVSIDGGAPTQLTNVFAYQPDVSPDGKYVVFGASNTRGELGICDLPACATVRRLTTPQGGAISRWTPDGKGIAFYTEGPGGNLWVQPLDGSGRRQLTHFGDNRTISDFTWSRDGKRLAINRHLVTNDIVLFKGLHR
jgi:Tol biopolymer transport system component